MVEQIPDVGLAEYGLAKYGLAECGLSDPFTADSGLAKYGLARYSPPFEACSLDNNFAIHMHIASELQVKR